MSLDKASNELIGLQGKIRGPTAVFNSYNSEDSKNLQRAVLDLVQVTLEGEVGPKVIFKLLNNLDDAFKPNNMQSTASTIDQNALVWEPASDADSLNLASTGREECHTVDFAVDETFTAVRHALAMLRSQDGRFSTTYALHMESQLQTILNDFGEYCIALIQERDGEILG